MTLLRFLIIEGKESIAEQNDSGEKIESIGRYAG